DNSLTDWLLNSAAMSGVLSDARAVSHRVFVEDVPSARHNLAPMLAPRHHAIAIRFNYHPFTRSRPTTGVEIEPYLIKLFRQRWYVAGRNVSEDRLKTYALDRMSAIELTSRRFEMPADFDPAEYFRHSFGIVVDASEPRDVILRTDPRQAKYLRALPLHWSQQEMVHDRFSDFSYRLLLTEDFLKELMTLGPSVEVIAPTELKTMLADRLRQTLSHYEK
ncbi:MAG: WYL domain-containing protein, partial [Muribaculaceae bacterium]|nr:WYL domain-containing protein [Muribaculaceae bacterium]